MSANIPDRGDVAAAPGPVIPHGPESMHPGARVIAAACVLRHAPAFGPRAVRAHAELVQAVDEYEAKARAAVAASLASRSDAALIARARLAEGRA